MADAKRRQIGRGCACWRCHQKKSRCDGTRPCKRCLQQMVADDCRDFYLWGPLEKAKPWPRWKKPSPINLRGAQAEIMKLDLISRRTIELYVNDGALEEATSVIDFSSREQMRAILNNVTGKTQTDAEVDAVIAVGQSYLQSLPLGRDGFLSSGEHQFACNVKVAENLSRDSFFFPESTCNSEAEGAQEEGGTTCAGR